MDQQNLEEFKKARHYALKRIAAQSYHSVLLGKCLQRKQFSLEVISKVMEEFKCLGFLNDAAWIEGFIKSHRTRLGAPLILAKLKSKGIDVRGLSIETDADSEKAAVLKLMNSRYSKRNLVDHKERQKVVAALMRKGFSWEIIRDVLGKVNGRVADIEEIRM